MYIFVLIYFSYFLILLFELDTVSDLRLNGGANLDRAGWHLPQCIRSDPWWLCYRVSVIPFSSIREPPCRPTMYAWNSNIVGTLPHVKWLNTHSPIVVFTNYSKADGLVMPPQTLFVVCYTVFTLSVRPCVRPWHFFFFLISWKRSDEYSSISLRVIALCKIS